MKALPVENAVGENRLLRRWRKFDLVRAPQAQQAGGVCAAGERVGGEPAQGAQDPIGRAGRGLRLLFLQHARAARLQ
eukprot:2456996-Pyramimonas_sp.AAC.1